tara:strand:+ start:474 stop:1391 length:918 start_codon:yes stop_codon:yes gene_type:complete
MNKKIRIGSRGSKLALLYAQKAKDKIIQKTNLNENEITIVSIKTLGDQAQDKRLSDIGGKGLFSSNIEKELQDKKIDIAVHALKDLPSYETRGLITDTFLERNDPREVILTNYNKNFIELKSNSIIGTSSYRREFQLKKIRPDLSYKLIRGNVDTRIKKLKEGAYDAIVLSYAGIKYLKYENEISEIFSPEKVIPSAGQGIIALQCREDDLQINSILKRVNHDETFKRAHAERNILKVLEGDCETAVGAYADIKGDKITLTAELFSLDGSKRYYEKRTKYLQEFKELGYEVGQNLKLISKVSYKK